MWPSNLCLFYDWPVVKDFSRILPSMLLILLMLAATAWGLLRNFGWAYLGAWFFGILAPTSSFVPISDLIFEHRLYLPLAGLTALVITTGYILLQKLAGWLRRSRETDTTLIMGKSASCVGGVLSIVIIAVLTLATINRNEDYHSAASIWQSVIDVLPNNHAAYKNLGNAFKKEGNIDEAIDRYRKALHLQPGYPSPYYNLGIIFEDQGNSVEAIRHYRKAISLKPDHAKAHHKLGFVLSNQGKLNEAISCYHQALKIDPDFAQPHNGLGIVFQSQGRFDEAISHYRKALQINPDCA